MQLDLSSFRAAGDGVRDDSAPLRSCFTAALDAGQSVIRIPPGNYRVSGEVPLPIPSHATVLAEGARFLLPDELGDRARIALFTGENVVDFHWCGGDFVGCCFDHYRPPNTWEPNANTRIFAITTTPGGITDRLSFDGLQGDRVAGAVVNVQGAKLSGHEELVETYATNVSVRNCSFADCGKFMWDYGLLWQILVWPEEYDPGHVAMARQYFPSQLLHTAVVMNDGDDRVGMQNDGEDAVTPGDNALHGVCFTGRELPANIVRGRIYYVVTATSDVIQVSERPGGEPIRFVGGAGSDTVVITRLSQAYHHLYAPLGAGPGKGCIDLVGCRNSLVTNNRMSALGDSMHIHSCDTTVVSGNQITGSRMGAFFLAEFCRNSVISGNTVDGTNGSRVLSVEKSNTDVTLTGNTFRGGGRGSWINQPRRLVMTGNIFVNNTTKGQRDPWRGRKDFTTGDYKRWPELYFTRYEPQGEYGPVILKDNLFVTGPECDAAITFAANGHDLVIDHNVIEGDERSIQIDPSCTNVTLGHNPGATVVTG